MKEYHKIPGVFYRSLDTHKLLSHTYRTPELMMLKDIRWRCTEKIDGTNIRVHWDGNEFAFAGRKEKSIIPEPLKNKLQELFCNNTMEQLFEQMFGNKEVIIFGEGFGKNIQKVGSLYNPDGVDFIVFDIMIEGNYQEDSNARCIATDLGLEFVPIVFTGTLEECVEFVKNSPTSKVAKQGCYMEGVVARPIIELQDRIGNRIITKIKYDDIKELEKTYRD